MNYCDILILLGSELIPLGRNFVFRREADILMDMLETMHYTVVPADCDETGFMGVSPLVHRAVIAATTRNRLEGGSRQALMEKLHAVWMVRRIRLRQFRHIRLGDELTGYGSSRTLCGNQYAQQGELYCAGQLAAMTNVIMMPVELRSRHRLNCEDIEPLFSVPALNEAASFDPLPMVDDLDYSHEVTFTGADCDNNASHLSFYRYPSLVTDIVPSGDGARSTISLLQMDYIKECVAGSCIHLGAEPLGKGYVVQARHKNGKPCFNAYIEYDHI